MESSLESEKNSLEETYRLVMSDLVSKFKTKGAVFDEVSSLAKKLAKERGSQELESIARNLTADSVRGWLGRQCKVPNHPFLIEVLSSVVSSQLSQEYPNFDFIIQNLRQARDKNKKQARSIELRVRQLVEAGYLAFEPTLSRRIDLVSLALGSWLFSGDIPPYTNRAHDRFLLEALESPQREILVLLGPPKSGKTRSLIEMLRRSTLEAAQVFWLTPSVSAIDEFIKSVPPGASKSRVIVIDDLQRIRPESELTIARLGKLQDRGMVIATLHDTTLDLWKRQIISHLDSEPIGPRIDAIEIIERNSVRCESELSEMEISEAQSAIQVDEHQFEDFKHLPSWAASVEQLAAKAKAMRHRPIEFATINAIIDAKILFPGGASLLSVESIAKYRFIEASPNSVWNTSAWEACLEEVTSGITIGSRHAILMRIAPESDSFLLLDALWTHLQPELWMPVGLNELGISTSQAASAAESAGLRSSAINILLAGKLDDDAEALTLLGDLLQFSNRWDEGRKYYKQAIALGSLWAEVHLANLEGNAGNWPESMRINEEFIARHPGTREASIAMFNLGSAYMVNVSYRSPLEDIDLAEHWINKAMKLGNKNYPLNNLGAIEFHRGNYLKAVRLFRKAAKHRDPKAFENLGLYHHKHGRLEDAISCYNSAFEIGGYSRRLELFGVVATIQGGHTEDSWYQRLLRVNETRSSCVTLLLVASYERRFAGLGSQAAERYEMVKNLPWTEEHHDDMADLEACGWWDDFDRAVIRELIGEELKSALHWNESNQSQ